MESLLLANTRVEDEDLKALELRRATAVQLALAKTVPGAADPLFLVTPRLAARAAAPNFKLKIGLNGDATIHAAQEIKSQT